MLENNKIFCLMADDEWYHSLSPIGFFTTREKAEAFRQEAKKEKKRWKNIRLFISECELDMEYERLSR